MALVDQKLDSRAVDEKSLMEWINRQARPVLIKLRDVVNARAGGYYAETFGDGASTVFTITHGLGSLDVHVQIYTVSTGVDATENYWFNAGGAITRVDANTLQLSCGVGVPLADDQRVVVRL